MFEIKKIKISFNFISEYHPLNIISKHLTSIHLTDRGSSIKIQIENGNYYNLVSLYNSKQLRDLVSYKRKKT